MLKSITFSLWRSFGALLAVAVALKAVLLQRQKKTLKMSITTIAGLGLIAYFFYKKIASIQSQIQQNQQNLEDYIDDRETEETPPAQRFLQITPEVTFSEITGNEWTGKITWKIKNTSSNYTFNITRIKSNIIMNGHTSLFVAGNKDSIRRLVPGASTEISATWQDKKWFNSSDVSSKDDLRAILRDRMDYKHPILECDIVIWVRGTGQVEETKYIFPQVQGTVNLESGAKHYYTNQGEYAGDWAD